MKASILEGLKHMKASILEGLKHVKASVLEGLKHVKASILKGLKHMKASILEGLKHVIQNDWSTYNIHEVKQEKVAMAVNGDQQQLTQYSSYIL